MPPPRRRTAIGRTSASPSRSAGAVPVPARRRQGLYEAGVASPATPLAGASSGAIVAVVAALSETGSPTLDDSLEAALRVNGYCRKEEARGQYC